MRRKGIAQEKSFHSLPILILPRSNLGYCKARQCMRQPKKALDTKESGDDKDEHPGKPATRGNGEPSGCHLKGRERSQVNYVGR